MHGDDISVKLLLVNGEFKLSGLTSAKSQNFNTLNRTLVLVPDSKGGPTEIVADFFSSDMWGMNT